MTDVSRPKVVFISYSHDSDQHREKVLGLCERLRNDGYDTRLDQYVNGTPEEKWPRWMMDQLDEASHVLVVCTETYYRRFRGHETPDCGFGVDWEGALITNEIYAAKSNTLKFVPVLFDSSQQEFIPDPLRGGTHYTLNSDASYDALCEFLEGVAGVEPRPVGERQPRERRRGTPLTFTDAKPITLPDVSLGRVFTERDDEATIGERLHVGDVPNPPFRFSRNAIAVTSAIIVVVTALLTFNYFFRENGNPPPQPLPPVNDNSPLVTLEKAQKDYAETKFEVAKTLFESLRGTKSSLIDRDELEKAIEAAAAMLEAKKANDLWRKEEKNFTKREEHEEDYISYLKKGNESYPFKTRIEEIP